MSEAFDHWLEAALRRELSPPPAPPPARYAALRAARPRAGRRWRLRMVPATAALGSRLLVGAGVVALAAAGVGVKTAVTGTANPLVWSNAAPIVQQCHASPSPTHGIGRCVSSAVVSSNPGSGRRASPSPPDLATASGTGPPGSETGGGAASSPATSAGHPTPPPHSHPTPRKTPPGQAKHSSPSASGSA